MPSVPLKDLPTTEAIDAEAQAYCRKMGRCRPEFRREVEEESKLRHYFGGEDVAYLRTPQGRVVIAHGDISSPEFAQDLGRLTQEERRDVIFYTPLPIELPASRS